MLIEIFTDRNYEQTCCDPENKIESRRAPMTVITEGGYDVRNDYTIVRDFILFAMNNKENNLFNGGYYILTIIRRIPDISSGITVYPAPSIEYTFEYKFVDIKSGNLIEGDVRMDKNSNIIYFTRGKQQSNEIKQVKSQFQDGKVDISPLAGYDYNSTTGNPPADSSFFITTAR